MLRIYVYTISLTLDAESNTLSLCVFAVTCIPLYVLPLLLIVPIAAFWTCICIEVNIFHCTSFRGQWRFVSLDWNLQKYNSLVKKMNDGKEQDVQIRSSCCYTSKEEPVCETNYDQMKFLKS